MSEELRPCPFCKGEFAFDFEIKKFRCDKCGATVLPDPYARTVNTRPIEDELRARIAELEGCIEELKKRIVELNWADRPALVGELKSRIAELEEKQRWRVVANGELPEEDGEYWVWFDDEFTGIKTSGYCDYSKQNGWDNTERVTHWMPLPTPPEVQE